MGGAWAGPGRHCRVRAQAWWAQVGVGGGRGQGQRGQGWCVDVDSKCGVDGVGVRSVNLLGVGVGMETALLLHWPQPCCRGHGKGRV